MHMIVNRDNLIKKITKIYPFNLADNEQIASLADRCDVVFFKSGDMIYIEGAAARYLYLIFEGEVEVLKEQNQTILKKNHLFVGDILGEDVFMDKRLRQTSARAVKDTLLVRINQSVLSGFIRNNTVVQAHFQPLINSYKLLVNNKQNLEFDRETVCYLGQPHKIYLISKSVFLFLLCLLGCLGTYYLVSMEIFSASAGIIGAGLLLGAYLIWFFWNFFEWANDLYFFTGRRVISQERGLILYESREETPLEAIISLSAQSSILGRQFGFGDLFIKTFTGSICLKSVPNITETQKFLEYLIEKNSLTRRSDEKRDFEDILRDRMGLERDTGTESRPEGSETGQGGQYTRERPPGFIARIFGSRHNEGDTVIYRTHWVFLMRKTIFPFLILASLISLMLYLRANTVGIAYNEVFVAIFFILLLFLTFWWFYQYLDWRNDQYMITPEQIIDLYRKPLGLEDKRAAPLENIQSIRYKRRGLLGILLNFGTVFIKVGNEDFTFDNVHDPLGIQQTLFGYLERANLIEKKANLAQQQRQIADWMDAYQRFSGENHENKQDKLE